MKVSALYPDVVFPVPRGTACLAKLVSWHVDDTTHSDMFNELENWVSLSVLFLFLVLPLWVVLLPFKVTHGETQTL